MLPPIPMLTTKKRAQIFLIFSLGFVVLAGATGCAPAGVRALRKGDRLLKDGKYSEAVQKFEEAKAAFPNNAKVWNHLGLGYQYAGDPKKAVQAYQQALSLDRNLAAARYNLGTLYLQQNNFSTAITELTTFTSLDSKNPDGWLKLGTAQMQLAALVSISERNRLLDAAKKNLDVAQKLRPSAETLNAMGLIQIQRGRPNDAIPSFTAALQQEPNYAPALLNLAVVYHQYLNERRLALVNYRQYLNVAKDSPEAAQVKITTQQLENELNPKAPPVNVTPAVANKSPSSNSPIVAAIAKTEANSTKVVSAPKPAPNVSSPKAQPLPKKETPVVVSRLSEETPIKPAQDIPAPVPKSLPMTSNAVVSTNQIHGTESPEKGSGLLTKLNPTSWFKKKPQQSERVTELPVVTLAPETSAVPVETKAAPKVEEKEKSTQLEIPRYRYRSPQKPPDGKRSEAGPHFAEGVKAQREQRLAEAIAAYRRAIKADPAYFEANYNLALVAREAGDLSATLHAYELALAITPDSENARYNFAFTLQEMGYFQDAANELRKLLALNPNATRAHLLLGNLCAQRLNQLSSAREHYLKVLEIEPNHPQATQIRYWLAAHS